MRKAPLFLLLIASIVSISTAEAANRDKSWEFGVTVNYLDGDTSGAGPSNPDKRSPEVDNDTGFSFRFGYNITAKSEVEVEVQVNDNDVGDRTADFVRASIQVTGNFLTDRDVNTIPYISAGLGVIQETRDAITLEGVKLLEAFDSSALLTLGAGARTFFNENWGVRYEVRYYHHDNFEQNQDEYSVDVGVTWIVGGQQ